ncbi:MAG: methionyl-tRNA formyltransferase [Clostridiales bacterium]|nr:methionyl-tRNA formyltransferase [Clostridiales bacterium]
MQRSDIRVIFMGTPELSATVLKGLCDGGYNVVMCVSQPDKPVGRKHIMTPPPAKVCAGELGIEVYQPDSLKTDEAYEHIKDAAPDLIVTAAYGKILPQRMLDIPRYGCINVHASLLPRYRGAAPVQFCIINGDDVTGVTIMKMDAGMDTGDMLTQTEVAVDIDDTTDTLMAKLADAGRDLLLDTISGYIEGKIPSIKQDEALVTLTSPVKPEDGIIDWNQTARQVHDRIRALSSWPGCSSTFNGKRIKIYASSLEAESSDDAAPGEITFAGKGKLKVRCGEGSIYILELQSEGGKRLKAIDCAHNYRAGQMFGA